MFNLSKLKDQILKIKDQMVCQQIFNEITATTEYIYLLEGIHNLCIAPFPDPRVAAQAPLDQKAQRPKKMHLTI